MSTGVLGVTAGGVQAATFTSTGVSIPATTASTSTTTGALTVAGGLGVAGAANIGTSVTTPVIYGSNVASGTLTLAGTSNATTGNIVMNPAGGKVGIGTTSPTSALEVAGSTLYLGTATGTADLRIYTAPVSGLNRYVDFNNTGSDFAVDISNNTGGVATRGFSIVNGATNLMKIQQNGSVGIGTTAPGQALDVVGSGNFSTSVISPLHTSAGVNMVVQPGVAASSGASLTLSGGVPTGSGNAGGNLILTGANGVTGNASGGSVSITAGAGVGTHAGGNVTITGGSSPSATGGAVTITGGTGNGAGGLVTIKGGTPVAGAYGGGVAITAADGNGIGQNGGSVTITAGVPGSGGNAGTIAFTTAGSEVARMTGSNVGIGTTAPTAKLNLAAGSATAGTAPLKFTSGTLLTTAEDGAMEYNSGTGLYFTIGSTRYVIPTNTAAGNYSNVSTIGNSSGSITMTPMAGNSVIVNSTTVSTSPTTGALVVSGGVGISGDVNTTGNILAGGGVTATTNMITPQLYGSTAASGSIKIDGTSNATPGNVYLASAGGKVGIGTSSPISIVDVKTATATNHLLLGVDSSATSYNAISLNGALTDAGMLGFFGGGGADSNFYFETPSGGNIIFRPNGSTGTTGVAQVNSTGMSIGVNNGPSALSVNGGVAIGSTYAGSSAAGANNLIVQGSVGIGTTAPDAVLTTVGSSASSALNLKSANGELRIWPGYTDGFTYLESGNAGFTGSSNGIKLTGSNGGTVPSFQALATTSYFSGSVGIGTTAPSKTLSLGGTAAQTFWMERGTSVGNSLTVQAGGGLSGGTDENGGSLILASGISTGAGASNMKFNIYQAGSAGTADNAATTAMLLDTAARVNINSTTATTNLARTEIISTAADSTALHVGTVGSSGGYASTVYGIKIDGNSPNAAPAYRGLDITKTQSNVESITGVNVTVSGAYSTQTGMSVQLNKNLDAITTGTGLSVTATSTGTTGNNNTLLAASFALNQTGGVSTDPQNVASFQNASTSGNSKLLTFGTEATFTERGGLFYDRANNAIDLNGNNAMSLSTGGTVRAFISSAGNVGIGTTAPGGKLDVNQATTGSTAMNAQTGGTAFWKVLSPAGGITAGYNAANAVEYVAKDTGTSRSINAAGTINATGADFAEWVDWPTTEKPQMGSVVLFKGSYVVVSSPSTAAFVGNDTKDPNQAVLIAFAGQLPVLVRGVVHEGDLIIANGDGTGMAVAKNQITLSLSGRVVGTAWGASDDKGLKRVNVAVGIGLGGNGARDISSIKSEVEKLKSENAMLKAYLCSKDPQAPICK